MKYYYGIFVFASFVLLSSCNNDTAIGPAGPPGPRGPVGPTGPQGADGENGFVFEWENINFTAPDYEVILAYPENFEGLNSDVALVYLLWDAYENNAGEVVEIWRPLAQNVLTEDGLLIYNFDFSKYDTRLFLDAEFPLDWLTAIDTDAWIARVVVVPGNFWNSGRIDFSDYQAVEEALGLPQMSKSRDYLKRRNPQ